MTETKKEEGHCSEQLTRIYEYLDGALSCDELAELDKHLASCEDCVKEHNLECVIRSVVKRSCSEQAPADLKGRILKKIDQIREDHAE